MFSPRCFHSKKYNNQIFIIIYSYLTKYNFTENIVNMEFMYLFFYFQISFLNNVVQILKQHFILHLGALTNFYLPQIFTNDVVIDRKETSPNQVFLHKRSLTIDAQVWCFFATIGHLSTLLVNNMFTVVRLLQISLNQDKEIQKNGRFTAFRTNSEE